MKTIRIEYICVINLKLERQIELQIHKKRTKEKRKRSSESELWENDIPVDEQLQHP